ncbi:hypothetical protein Q7P35_006907 [Cladosporium inversicolor]
MSEGFKLQDTKGEHWNQLAREYKEFSSGPGTAAVKVLVERTNERFPFAKATSILDDGCGPGPITSRIIDAHGHELPETCSILAADFSEGMVAQVEASKKEALSSLSSSVEGEGEGGKAEVWKRVETQVLDAMDLKGVLDGSKSHVMAGWVFFMTADPQKCLSESLRVLSPGGVLACTSWEGSQWLELMSTLHDVRADLKLPSLPEKWSNVDLLEKEFEIAGFEEVVVERVPVKMQYEKHETLVEFLIEKLPHAVALKAQMTDDEVKRWKELATVKCKEYNAEAPGSLSGWSLMAIGRK